MAAITTPLQGSAPAPGVVKSPRRRLLDGLYPYGYIAPSIAFMVIASFFPIIFTVYISMTDYGTGHIVSWNFIGLSNYQSIFDPAGISDFLNVLWWTVMFAAVTTLVCFSLGLVLAYLLNNENMWERNFYRTILIVPWALPGTIAILAWSGILDTNGLVNTFLIKFNIYPITFLADPFWARVSVFVVAFWLGYPFMMTACLGALQSISPEVLQAADIDGANGLQKFLRVTFPLAASGCSALGHLDVRVQSEQLWRRLSADVGRSRRERKHRLHGYPSDVHVQNCAGSPRVWAGVRLWRDHLRDNRHV